MFILFICFLQSFAERITNFHVAFAKGNTTHAAMTVSWQVISSSDYLPQVEVWKEGEDKKKFPAQYSCSYVGSGNHFHALLENLEISTFYFYRINGDDRLGSFTTAKGADTEKFSVPIFGDWGVGKIGFAEATKKRLSILKDDYDFVIHAGDIGYADDAFLHDWGTNFVGEKYEDVYNSFMDEIEDISMHKAYMVSPGNHESECHSPFCLFRPEYRHGLNNFTAYNCRWGMGLARDTIAQEKPPHSMWYSFDYGPVHFVALNTETDFKGAEEEFWGDCGWTCHLPAGNFGGYLEWLKNDLQEAHANRDKIPWVVTFGHRPFYAYAGDECFSPSLCDQVGDLIEQFSDMHFAGHVHTYSRGTPKTNKGPVHIISGAAGCDEWEGRPITDARAGVSDKFDWVGFGEEQVIGMLTVFGRERLEWQAITSEDGRVIDDVVVTPKNKIPNDHITIFEI